MHFVSPDGNVETAFYGTKLRYAAIVVNTSLTFTQLGYDEGLQVRDKWEEWVNDKLGQMNSKDTLEGFQTSAGLWHWLKVQQVRGDCRNNFIAHIFLTKTSTSSLTTFDEPNLNSFLKNQSY